MEMAQMTFDLSDPTFHDEDKAREHIEASRWPDGVNCQHCGSFNVMRMAGKTQAGYFLCRDCQGKFTCRTGTVMERSHIPLHKWLLAMRLISSSKKGTSAHQMHRMMNITYKSAWFMCHRIREAMNDDKEIGGIGGTGKVIEADETYVGGKAKNRAYKPEPKKHIVMTLVERGGKARSFHVKNATAKTLRETAVKIASRKSYLMTDENTAYTKLGKEFSSHGTVNHSADEYVRLGGFVHVNSAENYFSIFKRGVIGTFHHISEQHLHRYLAEFDFRYNNRSGLGVEDIERAARTLKGIEGKRLTYRQPREAAHA
jgi:transposase-like protein